MTVLVLNSRRDEFSVVVGSVRGGRGGQRGWSGVVAAPRAASPSPLYGGIATKAAATIHSDHARLVSIKTP